MQQQNSTQKTPKKIAKHSETEMLLEWNTGEQFAVPYVELRFYCPCAGCVDEHTGERVIEKTSIKPDIRPVEVQMVGRYAIAINWNDGHSTGIYHYESLYEICEKQGRRLGTA